MLFDIMLLYAELSDIPIPLLDEILFLIIILEKDSPIVIPRSLCVILLFDITLEDEERTKSIA